MPKRNKISKLNQLATQVDELAGTILEFAQNDHLPLPAGFDRAGLQAARYMAQVISQSNLGDKTWYAGGYIKILLENMQDSFPAHSFISPALTPNQDRALPVPAGTEIVAIPYLLNNNHWNMLVIDSVRKQIIYIDPKGVDDSAVKSNFDVRAIQAEIDIRKQRAVNDKLDEAVADLPAVVIEELRQTKAIESSRGLVSLLTIKQDIMTAYGTAIPDLTTYKWKSNSHATQISNNNDCGVWTVDCFREVMDEDNLIQIATQDNLDQQMISLMPDPIAAKQKCLDETIAKKSRENNCNDIHGHLASIKVDLEAFTGKPYLHKPTIATRLASLQEQLEEHWISDTIIGKMFIYALGQMTLFCNKNPELGSFVAPAKAEAIGKFEAKEIERQQNSQINAAHGKSSQITI